MIGREILNKFLLLMLLGHITGCESETKLQAIVYQLQKNVRKLGISRTFNYQFVRWTFGPYSKELNKDLAFLREKRLIDENHSITESGMHLLSKTERMVKKHYTIDEAAFYETSRKLNALDTKELLLKVYEDNSLKNAKMGKEIQSVLYRIETPVC